MKVSVPLLLLLTAASSLACPTAPLRSRYGNALATRELSEPLECCVGKSFCSQIPAASQIPGRRLPWHRTGSFLLAAGSLVPSLRSIQPPSNLSPPRQQCVVQTFSLPGASVDSCPPRSKSERILVCDTDILISFRLVPSASQTHQCSRGTPSPSLLMGDQEMGNRDKTVLHTSSLLGLSFRLT